VAGNPVLSVEHSRTFGLASRRSIHAAALIAATVSVVWLAGIYRESLYPDFPLDAYTTSDGRILIEAFGHLSLGVIALLIASLLFINWRSWNPGLRFIWCVASAPVIWSVITEAPGMYSTSFPFDRLALLLVWGASIKLPIFSPLTIVIAHAISFEEFYPILQTAGWTDRYLNYNLMVVIVALQVVSNIGALITREHEPTSSDPLKLRSAEPLGIAFSGNLVARSVSNVLTSLSWRDSVVFGIVATHYIVPGINKIRIGWFTEQELKFSLFAKVAQGWIATDANSLEYLGRVVDSVNPLLLSAVLVMEVGAVCLFFPRLRFPWLLILITLHIGIFLATGILFWKWMFVNGGLALYVIITRRRNKSRSDKRDTLLPALAAALTCATAFVYLPIPPLAWIDTRYQYVYELETISSTGQIQELHWSNFRRHDLFFGSHRLHFLLDGPHADPRRVRGSEWSIDGFRSIDSMNMWHSKFGRNYSNPQLRDAFDSLVRKHFTNCRFTSLDNKTALEAFKINHFYMWPSRPPPTGPVEYVTVRRTLLDLDKSPAAWKVQRELVHRVPICPAPVDG
jgi:hypothetical protein